MVEPCAESRASPRPCKKAWLLLTASSAVQKGPKKEGEKSRKELMLGCLGPSATAEVQYWILEM